ncbi:MAG: hypothetical protein ACOX6U_07305 [Oscillospiraceae bacterium]|jgi:hypothetical protein
MRVFRWEVRKIVETPALWVFLAACLLINSILIFTSTYDRGYAQFVSKTATQLGTRVDAEFLEKLKQMPQSEEQERLLQTLESVLYVDADGQVKGSFGEIEAADYAEAFIKELGMSGPIADLFTAKYDALQPVIDRLAAEGADADLYAADLSNELFRQLFDALLHTLLTEGILLAFLSVLLSMGSEALHRTSALVLSSRIGRKIAFTKASAGTLCGLVFYALLNAVSLPFYFLQWDYTGFWNSSISTSFHVSPEYLGARPFLTWTEMTVGQYFWMQLALSAALVLVFCLMGTLTGILVRNTYAAFVVVLAVGMLLLLLPGWFATLHWFWAMFAFLLSPFQIWSLQNSWFTDLGSNSLWAWWEISGVFLSGLVFVLLLIAAYKWYRRKDVV